MDSWSRSKISLLAICVSLHVPHASTPQFHEWNEGGEHWLHMPIQLGDVPELAVNAGSRFLRSETRFDNEYPAWSSSEP